MRRIVLVALLVVALVVAFIAVTTPSHTGGSSTYIGPPVHTTSKLTHVGPIRTMSLIQVSQRTWKRKGKIRHIGHHVTVQRVRSANGSYRVEAEVHGDSWKIDQVVQGFGHFKLTPKAGTHHTKVADRYTNASASHRESWLWRLNYLNTTKGAGVSTTWCNGGVGPCQAVQYRYWRFTFQWIQGVSIFGQDFAHHSTLYIGCTLRANYTYHCGTGEA